MLIKTEKNGNVFVIGHYMKRLIEKMFEEHHFKIVQHHKDSDYVCYTGGDDIHPQMYGEKVLAGTYPNPNQDERDCSVFSECINDRFLLGICRGAQLLNVLNGGKLWQDVDGHNTGGTHIVHDAILGTEITVNTLHHQQMIVPDNGELVAYTSVSRNKIGEKAEWKYDGMQGSEEVDPEVVWFPHTNSLCFQPHPEFEHEPTRTYFLDLMRRYCSPF